jgi:hypothetical protein
MLPMDHTLPRFLYFTSAGVKCCVTAVKTNAQYYTSVLLYFVGPAELLIALEIEYTPRGSDGCCTSNFPPCTDSIKPINNSEGSYLIQTILPKSHQTHLTSNRRF